MKAVVVEATCGIGVLHCKDHEVPLQLSPKEVLVKNEYAGLNFIDTYHRSGLYPRAGFAKKGDWVLVYGCGSGTGQWTSQMCKLRGYKVIGTTSKGKVSDVSDAKSAFGCDELIILENAADKSYADYTSVDIASKVMEITGGKGCTLINDGIGKETYEISFKCLAKRGMFVSFGNASGAVPAFPVLRLLPQSAYMTRPKLNDYIATREELLERANDVFTWIKEGKLNIVIDKVFKLEQVQSAHEYLENGGAKGKVLLKL